MTTTRILYPKIIIREFQLTIQDKEPGEICLTYHKENKKFYWYDKSMMYENMKQWRKSAKEGIIKICKYNNKSFVFDGVTYYTLIIQSYKNEKQQPNSACDMMLSVFNHLVTGYGYCFKTETNRDDIYNYVMKGINE